MKDVAREAGVALGTVSKVFNGLPVGDSYREKVEAAAKRLGYQVNSYARGLKTNKTYTVAMIFPNITDPFFALLAEHTSLCLAKRGYRSLLSLTGSDPEAEQACIRMVEQNKVDGIISLTYNPDLEVNGQIPFVSIDRYFSSEVPCIASDNFGGGQMAAEKLLSLGCNKLLFLRIGSNVSGETDKRGVGFQTVCQNRQIPFEMLMLEDSQGFETFRTFLEAHIRGGKLEFDGIFCNTDRLAYYIIKYLKELGIKVPEDVQIIGFDGVRQFNSEDLYCSTIVQPMAQLAETSVDIVLREDRSNLPSLICLPVSYVPGGTTKELWPANT